MTKRLFIILAIALCTLSCVVVDLNGTPTPGAKPPTPPHAGMATITAAATASPTNTPAKVATTPQAKTCKVNATALNVRTGPGLGYGAFAWLYAGESVTVLPTPHPAEWLPVEFGSLSGWIHSNYCEVKP